MRIAASLLSLALSLAALSCGGEAQGSASSGHAPLEAVAHHNRCPSDDRRDEASRDPRTATVLVPSGATSALVCRYWGLHDSGQKGTFAGGRLVTDTTALNRAAARLNALPAPPRTPGSCPVFGDRSALIFFHYRHASDDPVRISVYCHVPVSNGRIVKEALGLGKLGEAHWVDELLL
jgi:hypothetical protein